MRYVTGMHALNLGDRTSTPGDWHFSAMDWQLPMTLESGRSPFGDYGITPQDVPGHGVMPVASHIRACLDLIEQGLYGSAQGMRDDFIANPAYDREIMDQVWKLPPGLAANRPVHGTRIPRSMARLQAGPATRHRGMTMEHRTGRCDTP